MQTDLYLIDTSAWIFALRKNYYKQIKSRIDLLLEQDVILTTGIITLELLGGTRNELEYQRLKKNLCALNQVETDNSLWETSFELAFSLRRKGLAVPYTDIIIAACALKRNAIILHADNHFDLISKHVDVRIESYTSQINYPSQ